MGSDQGSDEVEVSDHDEVNIIDEGHIIDEVEVNVKGFRFSVEEDVVHEPLHPKVNVKENGLEILDFDSIDSDVSDDSNSARRAALRNLKKEGKNVYTSVYDSDATIEFQILAWLAVRTDPRIYLGLDPSLVMVDSCDVAGTYFVF
ncbi:hypothetical protein Tco_0849982 [Tanacetum coccineum]